MLGRSSSSVDARATSVASSPRSDSNWIWFHKGFVEGLKRARTPASADGEFEELAYDREELRIQLEETKIKLSDTTETLGEVQEMFKHLIKEPNETPNFDLVLNNRTASLAPSSPPPAVLRGGTHPEFQLPQASRVGQDHRPQPQPSSSRRRTQAPSRPLASRPIRRDYVEMARSLIPGYYSTNNSELVRTTIDTALKTLFRKAQAGDESSMALVKALCREAHATPAERKTYGQKYILSRWRNPLLLSQQSPQNFFAETDHLINPQYDDPPEAWVAYYTRYPKSLPKGVRVHPETGAPFLNDIVASRLLARLRPTSSQYRAEFNVAMISLFIQKGQYSKLVRDRVVESPQTTMNYQPFDPDCLREEPITTLDVARHYSKCGVSIETVENNVESWVAEYAKAKYDT